MNMTKKEFNELTGENPEDVLGNDWQNDLEDMAKNAAINDAGLTEEEAENAVNDLL